MPATLDADPTLELVERLADPTAWAAVKRGVPVFKPHAGPKRDSQGQLREVAVTEADLERIARRTNERYSASGVPVTLWADHRDLNGKAGAKDQPPLLGYAKDLRVGTFGPKDEPAILADFYFLEEHYELAKELIHRSVDYYPAAGDIDGVALMKRRPHLDLGVIQFRQRAEPCLQYAFGDDDPPDGMPDDAPGGDAPAPEAPVAPAGPDPDWLRNMEMFMASNPQCFAQGAAPGAPPMGAAPPAPAPAPMPLPDEAMRMQHDQQSLQYARMEGKVAELEKKLAAQTQAAERAVCEQYVTQLEAEGYQLDRAEEVTALAPLSPEKRKARLAYIRKHYRQEAAIAGAVPYSHTDMVPVADDTGPPNPHRPEKDREQVLAYIWDHPGVTYDQAVAAVRSRAVS